MMSLSARNFARYRHRFVLVATNSLNSLLLPLLNVLVSLFVVRVASVELWGALVDVLIVVQIGAHVIAWGNKEYLLRAFSRDPAHIARAWQSSLVTRFLLLPTLALPIALLGWPMERAFLVWLWTCGLVVHQSCEVLVLYRRAFVAAILVELGGIAVLLAAIAGLGTGITLDHLLLLFCLVTLGKGSALALYFRHYSLSPVGDRLSLRSRLDVRYFGLALPFFLLGFSGMLQSRIDLYSVSFFLSEREVGQYQVFINLMIYLQAIANFVLMPFVKSLYRMDYSTIHKISTRLFSLGLLLVPLALLAVHWTLSYVYSFALPSAFLLLGGLYVLPVYFYLPIVYALYRADLQNTVVWINAAGAALNLLLNVLLIPRTGAPGALVATALVQWFVLACYLFPGRNLIRADVPARKRESHGSALP